MLRPAAREKVGMRTAGHYEDEMLKLLQVQTAELGDGRHWQ